MPDTNRCGPGAVLGVDIGGTSLKLALVWPDGQTADSLRYPTQRGTLDALLEQVDKAASVLMARNRYIRLTAVGMGIKSMTDHRRQRVSSSTLVTDRRDFDITAGLRERFHVPVVMDNDVNAMAVGELLFGWGRERSDFLYVNVGTGLGACPVLEGRPYRGVRGWAGELCAFLVPFGDGFRQIESFVSGAGCDSEVRRRAPAFPHSVLAPLLAEPGRRIRSDELFGACRGGDPLAAAVTEDMARALALAILNTEALLDCGLFVFGGGVMDSKWFLSRVREAKKLLAASAGLSDSTDLQLSQLGANDSGVIGAAALAYYEYKEEHHGSD